VTIGDAGLEPELTREGPLNPETAARLLARADELLAAAEFPIAARYYQRVIGATPNPEQTAAALFGLGTALYRLDQEDAARGTWGQILALPETPYTYRAWREIAGARVRDGDLVGAQKAYLEAQRRAPAEDRPEIESRLGWLKKETGDLRGAGRHFARSRGGQPPPYLTYATIAVTAVVSVAAFEPRSGLFELLALDKLRLAQGEYWRLWTVTLLHGSYLHLFFNMYALYLAGSLVEQIYGPRLFALMYLLAAAAGSVGSFLFGGDAPSVGASGAVFGLFGVLLAVSRTHHPVLDRRGQMLLGQIGGLIVLNLVFGLGFNVVGGNIDNFAHVGGLIAGLWLGFLLVPGGVPTLSSLWQRSGGGDLVTAPGAGALRMLGVLALIVAIAFGVVVGSQARKGGASVIDTRTGAVVSSEAHPAAVPSAAAPPTVSRDAAWEPAAGSR
jgi:membrane associated rhomboid family serine protease